MTRTAGMQDYSDRTVQPNKCAHCEATFQPKTMGYNGAYCSPRCKTAARSQRESNPEDRSAKREYMRGYVRKRMAADAAFKEQHDARAASYRKNVRDWLAAYKLSHGCVDCGYRAHYAALQLDHEGPKSVEIANARSSIARLKAEIESGQCKVRCANCHSVRTWQQKQNPAKNGASA